MHKSNILFILHITVFKKQESIQINAYSQQGVAIEVLQ